MRIRLLMWSVLTVASFVMIAMNAEVTYGRKRDPMTSLWVLVFLVLLFFVGASYGSLRRLHKARKVLRSYPWEYRESARKTAKEAMGIAVQLKPGDGQDGWTRGMVARNPLKWNRWNPEMERGAWFAGDLPLGGVIALPGGSGLMLLGVRYRLGIDERGAIARQSDRMTRAKSAGIHRNASAGYR
ncbi:hypothetical protein ACFPK5_28045 [Streptomyces beijiangensis]